MGHVHFFSFNIDKNISINEEYSFGLVILSYCVAVLAGYSASVINHFIALKSKKSDTTYLKIFGGATLALGIWSMHFIGMLAFSVNMPVKYDILTTVISLIPAMLAATSIIHFVSTAKPSNGKIIFYGLLLAFGIASMHFIGMAAMSLNAIMVHDPSIFVLSVILSWMLAVIALCIQLKKFKSLRYLSNSTVSVLSALAFGFSVASMHYIAMQSAYFLPIVNNSELVGVSIDYIEKAVIIGSVILVLSLTVVLSYKSKILLLNEKAERKEVQILDTVENMSEPYIFTDSGGTILLVNNSFHINFPEMAVYLENKVPVDDLLQHFSECYINRDGDTFTLTSSEEAELKFTAHDLKVWLLKKNKSASNNYIYTWVNITNEVKKQEELLNAKDQAIHSLEQLQATQIELAETKRLASVGKLVTDVAHELNTPLGVAITSLSCLREKTEALETLFKQGTISKNGLDTYLLEVYECEQLAKKNMTKAAKIIERFKLLSGIKSEEKLSQVNLNSYFQKVRNILLNEVNGIEINISLDIGDDIVIETLENSLLQVILILFENSVIHGFEGQSSGEVLIAAIENENEVVIVYKDNGKGISEDIQGEVFEPFTSSKKFEGNIGLGLHIAHNIAHQQLKAKLKLRESNAIGSAFHITLPKS